MGDNRVSRGHSILSRMGLIKSPGSFPVPVHCVAVTLLLPRGSQKDLPLTVSLYCLSLTLNFQGTIERKKEDFVLKNEEASIKYCQDELKKLSEPLIEGISRGAFSVPGGHSLYLEAKRKVEQDYQLVPRKGVKVRNGEEGVQFKEHSERVFAAPSENLRP
jgi:hypothetical protein